MSLQANKKNNMHKSKDQLTKRTNEHKVTGL